MEHKRHRPSETTNKATNAAKQLTRCTRVTGASIGMTGNTDSATASSSTGAGAIESGVVGRGLRSAQQRVDRAGPVEGALVAKTCAPKRNWFLRDRTPADVMYSITNPLLRRTAAAVALIHWVTPVEAHSGEDIEDVIEYDFATSVVLTIIAMLSIHIIFHMLAGSCVPYPGRIAQIDPATGRWNRRLAVYCVWLQSRFTFSKFFRLIAQALKFLAYVIEPSLIVSAESGVFGSSQDMVDASTSESLRGTHGVGTVVRANALDHSLAGTSYGCTRCGRLVPHDKMWCHECTSYAFNMRGPLAYGTHEI